MAAEDEAPTPGQVDQVASIVAETLKRASKRRAAQVDDTRSLEEKIASARAAGLLAIEARLTDLRGRRRRYRPRGRHGGVIVVIMLTAHRGRRSVHVETIKRTPMRPFDQRQAAHTSARRNLLPVALDGKTPLGEVQGLRHPQLASRRLESELNKMIDSAHREQQQWRRQHIAGDPVPAPRAGQRRSAAI